MGYDLGFDIAVLDSMGGNEKVTMKCCSEVETSI